MSSDAPPAEPMALSPRAGVALLTLRLRTAQQEALAAEREAADWDLEASIAHVKARLAPRVDDRRQTLDDELVRERADAAEAVAKARADATQVVEAARVEAQAIAAERERRAAAEREAIAAEVAAVAAAALALSHAEEQAQGGSDADETIDDDAAPAMIADAITDDDTVVEADVDSGSVQAVIASSAPADAATDGPADLGEAASGAQPADATSLETVARLTALRMLVDELLRASAAGTPLPDVVTAPPESASIKVVIDADSFSKAFSTAMSSMMDERLAMHRAQQEAWMSAPWRVVPAATPPAKKSFWANAWHADVLLSVIAMIIVLVVLIAWST